MEIRFAVHFQIGRVIFDVQSRPFEPDGHAFIHVLGGDRLASVTGFSLFWRHDKPWSGGLLCLGFGFNFLEGETYPHIVSLGWTR